MHCLCEFYFKKKTGKIAKLCFDKKKFIKCGSNQIEAKTSQNVMLFGEFSLEKKLRKFFR